MSKNPSQPKVKKFRIQNTQLFLTYSDVTGVNLLEIFNFIMDKTKDQGPKKWIFKRETHPSTPTKFHFHVLIQWVRQIITESPAFFDFGKFHPSIETIKNKYQWAEKNIYMDKEEDPMSVDNTITNIATEEQLRQSEINDAFTSKSSIDLIRKRGKTSNIKSLLEMRRHRPKDPVPEPEKKPEWNEIQDKIYKYVCNQPPDQKEEDDTIQWYYDPSNSSGKEQISKYLAMHTSFTHLSINPTPHCVFNNIFRKFERDGKHYTTFIIMMYSDMNYLNKSFYKFIQTLKSGVIPTKESESILMPNPQIIIFSNVLPDLSVITKKGLILYHAIDGKEVESVDYNKSYLVETKAEKEKLLKYLEEKKVKEEGIQRYNDIKNKTRKL